MYKKLLGFFSIILGLVLLVACGTKSFTVSFDVNGGKEEIAELKVEEGKLLDIPVEPTKEGYVFDFWLEKDTDKKWNFALDKVTKNITLVAQWKEPEVITYNVKFFTLGGTPEPADQEIVQNEKVEKPADPTREGYRFLGWYLPDATETYDFNTPVVSDLMISAKWDKIEYATVKFNLDGGIPTISDKVIEKGEKVEKPANPTKDGYTFIGWFVETEEFNFNLAINDDVTIVAKWEEIIVNYEVTFDLGYDDLKLDPQTVIEAELAEKPTDPTREGYKFLDWYLEGEPFDFLTPINDDISLVAMWQKEHTVKFYLDTELTKEYETIVALDGQLIDEPTNPELVGFIFKGWYVDEVLFNFNDPIETDLIIVALWDEEFVVSFYIDDEATEFYAQYIVAAGNLTPTPAEPTKDFHDFLGWYVGENLYNFEDPVLSSLTIVGKWEAEEFTARAFIGEKEYQSINLAVMDATEGDTILIAEGIHDMEVLVNVNNLTFKPVTEEAVAVITTKFTLEAGIDGITFNGLNFTGNAEIHGPGAIDNFVFTNNKVYDSTIEAGTYYPANRIDVPAFIRFFTLASENVVGNVTVTNNEFINIEAVIISLARTSAGKEIILRDNTFNNIKNSAIRFDGGYNNGTYTIEKNLFENDLEVENLSVITFRAYSSSSANTQIINIVDNEFINMGSTEFPIAETHPGSGVITFSTYNEGPTIITISNNIFNNPANAVHLRDSRGSHTNLSFTLENNEFIDGTGFILYESNYREADTNITLGTNTYIVDGITVTEEVIGERIIRIPQT